MIDRNKVIATAIREIGYHEKASNAFLDEPIQNAGDGNWTKYARDLDAIPGFYNGPKNGYDWCDIFVDWCFIRTYGAPIGLGLLCQPVASAGAGCEFSAQYYKSKGRWRTEPEPGDQVFFSYGGGISHTGIVVNVTAVAIITVEGNVNGQVVQTSYPHSSGAIAGYGRPCWELFEEKETETTSQPANADPGEPIEITLPEITYGDESVWVKVMQTLLIDKGFSCGIYGPDGEYGVQTKIALYEFQKAAGLETNCICGSTTWKKLFVNERLR